MQGLGNGTQEGLLCQVRDDGIVDLRQGAVLFFTLTEGCLRLFPLRDIDKRVDGAQGSTFANDNVGPKFDRKARAILSPINLIVSVNIFVFLEANIDGTFFNWIWGAVFSVMVFKRVHVFPDQFGGIVISEDVRP
jgi:hypothetical protein